MNYKLRSWRPDEPERAGLSERGLRMCLSALSRWQAEHPDKRIELGADGRYGVVPAGPVADEKRGDE